MGEPGKALLEGGHLGDLFVDRHAVLIAFRFFRRAPNSRPKNMYSIPAALSVGCDDLAVEMFQPAVGLRADVGKACDLMPVQQGQKIIERMIGMANGKHGRFFAGHLIVVHNALTPCPSPKGRGEKSQLFAAYSSANSRAQLSIISSKQVGSASGRRWYWERLKTSRLRMVALQINSNTWDARERADDHFQAAVGGSPAGWAEAEVVAADGPAPASFVHDVFENETRELVGHVFQTAFDALGEFQAILGVEALEFFFVYGPVAFGLRRLCACPLTALDRLLQPMLKFHDG